MNPGEPAVETWNDPVKDEVGNKRRKALPGSNVPEEFADPNPPGPVRTKNNSGASARKVSRGKPANIWTLDPDHTHVEFRVRHMMVSWVRGFFKDVSGTLTFDPENPEQLAVEATVPVKSIETGVTARDEHLRSADDFFDVNRFPEATFKSQKAEKISDTEYDVTGDFTLRGVTKEITLRVTYGGMQEGEHEQRIGFMATTQLDRRDFGVTWNKPLDKGGVVVGNDVQITVEGEATREMKK